MIESADKAYIDELSARVRTLETLLRHLAPRHPHCHTCQDLLGPPGAPDGWLAASPREP